MSRRTQELLRFLTVVVDMAMATAAFYLAHMLREAVPFPVPLRLGPFRNYAVQLMTYVLSLLAVFFFHRLYHLRRAASRIDQFYTILSAISIATLAATALTYLAFRASADLARGMILYAWALSIPMVTFGRFLSGLIQRFVRSRRPDRLLLVGTGDIAKMILQKTIGSPQLGYRVIGFVDGNGAGGEIEGLPILGSQGDLTTVLKRHHVQEVMIALREASHDQLLDIISACESEHATVRIFPDLFQIIASDLRISDLDGLPLLTVRDVALRGWKLTAKRMIDVTISAMGLIFLSPVLLLIGLAIVIESKGSIFYSQVRVGLDGRPFQMLKFRSMRVDAEKETGPVWATQDDPRRTHVGSFLRETSLDELPNLINVLMGEMSIVGPRPERPVFVEQFGQVVPRYMERHKEKAGITGWAQVNGLRGDTSIVDRTKYDIYYIENWSLLFDLKIVLRTMLNQLRGDRNAY